MCVSQKYLNIEETMNRGKNYLLIVYCFFMNRQNVSLFQPSGKILDFRQFWFHYGWPNEL